MRYVFHPESLAWERTKKGLTQRETARRAGLSKNAVHRAEAGTFNPRPNTVKALADALEIPVETLYKCCEPVA